MQTQEIYCPTCDLVIGHIEKEEITSKDITEIVESTTCDLGHTVEVR